jgi:rRNA maturation protein Nop10
MSYCVNCGVELETSQKACPLCGVKVINPLAPEYEEKVTYPRYRDEFKKKDRIFWIKFISVLLAVPIITCVLSDLLVTKYLSWSIYAISGIMLLWVLSTSPLYFKKFSTIKMLLIDISAVIIFLAVIESTTGGRAWFVPIAFPICTYLLISSLAVIFFHRLFSLSGLGIAAAINICIGVMIPGLEILIDLYNTGIIDLFWCWFVTASTFSVAALLILLGNNKKFKIAFEKRLHF